MKKIALIHSGPGYVPEIGIYKYYLEKEGYFVQILKKAQESELKLFDVEWHFMGMDTTQRKTNRLKIHEYVSLSVPPFSKWKDKIKKDLNSKPDLRIFGSEFIEKELSFSDNIPVCYRDAGVSPAFFKKPKNIVPEFDFVYSGSTDKTRKIGQLLSFFVENMPDNKLLVIGTPPNGLPIRIIHHPAITFTGRVNYEEVPAWLHKSRFGINYMPNLYPYQNQFSYKLLDYCAAGLPVITTEYTWVNNFERQSKAKFFKLNADLSSFKMSLVEGFDFRIPDVTSFIWDKIISQSGILSFLKQNL